MRHRVHGQKRVHGRKRVHSKIEKEQAELATHSVSSHGAEPKCVRHGVHGQKRVHGRRRVHGGKIFTVEKKKSKRSLPHIVHASHVVEPKFLHHGVQGRKRFHGWKTVNGAIEKEQGEPKNSHVTALYL